MKTPKVMSKKRFKSSLFLAALLLFAATQIAFTQDNQDTEVFIQLGHSDNVTSVAFSPDGKYALSGSEDKTLKLWEVKSAKEIRTFNGHSETVNSVAFSPDGRYALSGSEDKTLKLWGVSSGREVRTFTGHSELITSVAFSPDGRYALSGSYDETLKLWNVSSGREVRTFTGDSEPVSSVAFSPDGRYALSGSWDKTIKLWELASGEEIRTLEGKSSDGMCSSVMDCWVNSVAFSPDGKYALSGSDDKTLKLWVVTSGREVRTFTRHSNRVNSVAFSPDGRYALSGGRDATLKLWDVSSGREVRTFSGNSEFITSVAFSPDGRYALSGSYDHTLKLWEVSSGKEVRTFRGHSSLVESVAFSPDGLYALSASSDKTLKLWEISSGREVRTFTGHSNWVNTVAFSPDGRYALSASSDDTMKLWEVESGLEVRTFSGHSDGVNTVAFSPDGRYALSGSDDNTLKLWEVSSGREVRAFTGHSEFITSVAFSPDGRYALSGSKDGTTRIWDIVNKGQIATFIDLPDKEFATALPDNYYTASRNASKYVHFLNGMNVYTFENFDLIFNRPDIVAERLGNTSPDLINAYYKAYLKRLDKMGFTESQISTDMHLPEVAFLREDFPIQTSEKTLKFEVKATDSKYKLDRLNVYVNDVPVYGTRGINLKDRDTQEATIPVELTLSNGANKIQISAHNQAGAESLKETIELTYSGPKAASDLYVVAIGVSDYQNDDYDLRYAAKDANDLAALYSQTGAFEKVHKFTLTDGEATRENILALKEKLNQNKVDDQVVLFVAGHGLLDDDFDYYFATHDIDFDNPSGKGVTYTQLEGLLDGIPARNKLLLMDTCNSGEVDKSSVEVTESEQLASNVSARAVGTRGIKMKKDGDVADSDLGLQNIFELMKELFADLRRGSGAMVISSASGVEFALESDLWKNGVFTYAVLNGLKNETADQNKNGTITVSELRDHVAEQVQKLTNGQQSPTSRRENLTNDFVVW